MRRLITTSAILSFLLLLVGTQLIVDAEYISAFRLTGGAGKWSDAIYDLAAYARENRDKTLLLMDWGFSSQLLALSDGRIKKFEAFVPVILAPEARQLQVMYSYMLSFNSLLVFHSPRCETFPVLKTFQQALCEYGLRARLVKVFHERSGAPAYVVFEVVRPEIEEHLGTTGFFAAREAEEWDEKRGGGIEDRDSASNHRMLGWFWGRSRSDLVTYWFTLPRTVPNIRLYIRYANEAPRERQLELFVDGKSARTLSLASTGGPGNRPQEWALANVELEALHPGKHEVRIQPAGDHQVVFLDYLYLADRELRVEPSGPCRCESAEAPVDTLFEVLGYQELPEVRLIVSPQVARAGETVLTLRVLNFDVPAIDVLYSFNGNLMPLVYGWPLDDKNSVRVLVDSTTPKGSYWYRAIRDARDGSPTAWIAVDARVEVR